MNSLCLSIWDGIRAYYIRQYLNDGYITEREYIRFYNRFAENTGTEPLETEDDIFTDKNKQNEFIADIVRNYDPFFERVYTFVSNIITDIRESEEE